MKALIRVEGGVVSDIFSDSDLKIEVFDIDNLKAEGNSLKKIEQLYQKSVNGLHPVY